MKKKLVVTIALLAGLMVPATLHASGFGYYEHGAKATAMAGAFVGRADDVTAVFYNPAGIAFLEGTNIHFGMHPVNINFTSSISGISTEDDNDWLPPSSIFISKKLTDKLAVGFGFFLPFGLNVDWPNNASTWPGIQIAYHTAVRSYYFQPTIAYKVNDQLSIGLGVDIVRAKVELSRAPVQSITYHPLLPPLNVSIDTQVEATGYGYGVNLGVLYKVNPKFQIGFSYKSEIDIDFEGDVDFSFTSTGIPAIDATLGAVFYDQGAETNIKMPQIFAVGTMYKFDEKTSLQVDLQFTGWSSFETLPFDFENDMLDTVDENNWDDTLTFRVGGEHWFAHEWAFRAGYIFDQAAIPESTLKPLLPDSSRNELTLGLGYDTKESCCWGRFALDLAMQFIWADEVTSTYPYFPATYESDAMILGLGVSFTF